ncbi:hypothetical protein DSM104299_01988 [Baekduia alba]|uniref:hypothetical protein n=1 Tax=Baekduia alba TaxID=2997333 RepID=UPI00233FE77E|nr:hypothetical protein [Baekduia alba]WCB93276.1 hypothetical protein DSM104299_01988 [Baekduia alba]
MPSKLRKSPGSPADLGAYRASGPLDGIVPGRRTVKILDLQNVDGSGTEGLEPLQAFEDLEELQLERVRNLDLAVLGQLPALRRLRLERVAGVDLGTLTAPAQLEALRVFDLDDDCVVPEQMPLPASVCDIALSESRRGHTGRQVAKLVAAIDWSRLPNLTRLSIRVGGLDDVEPAQVDLGLLRHLPLLESLFLYGVEHTGAGPSPLRPPFDGIPRQNLNRLIIDAPLAERDLITNELRETFGFEEIAVRARKPFVPPPPPWQISETSDGQFAVYGSLADAFDLSSDETEVDALRTARRRLREADPKLLRALDFDPESGGTAIAAASRSDLEQALSVLGLA